MFDALGLGGGSSVSLNSDQPETAIYRLPFVSVKLLAGLAIILGIPFPVWIYYRGEAIRAKSDLTR
jgi:hypothetical protein